MKVPIIAGVILLVLALTFYFFYLVKGNPTPTVESNFVADDDDRRQILDMCFYKEVANKKLGVTDEYRLNIYTMGNQVQGDLAFLPGAGYVKSGMFYGTLGRVNEDQAIEVWWDAYERDTNTKEELRIVLADGEARIGQGPMQDNADGTFFYKNKNKLNYDIVLAEIACR